MIVANISSFPVVILQLQSFFPENGSPKLNTILALTTVYLLSQTSSSMAHVFNFISTWLGAPLTLILPPILYYRSLERPVRAIDLTMMGLSLVAGTKAMLIATFG